MIQSTDFSWFGRRIKRIRKVRNLSIHEVSKKMGCEPSYLMKIEDGTIIPSASELVFLAEIYDISTDFILNRI